MTGKRKKNKETLKDSENEMRKKNRKKDLIKGRTYTHFNLVKYFVVMFFFA